MLVYLDTLIGFSVVMLLISLLITILTQIVSTLANHRGSNLRWGLKTLFERIDPGTYPKLAASANRVAHEVLKHSLISDSWFSDVKAVQWMLDLPVLKQILGRFQLASAIRPIELTNILRQFAASSAQPGVLRNLAAADWTALRTEIAALLDAPNPEANRRVAQAARVAVAAGAISDQAKTLLLQDSVSAIRGAEGKLEEWFGSMMDRVAQKFTMYMRLWTVLFAGAFALATGLNSITLLTGLYTNSALRNSLAGASQQALAAAGTVLDKGNTAATASTGALRQAVQGDTAPAAPQPPDIRTAAEGDAWIQANLPAGRRAAALGRFDAAFAAASRKALDDAAQSAANANAIASQAGFDILKPRWPANPDGRYVLGVLITAALLSLGAPFWFNALKSLANLRPIVASKEQAEQAS